MPHNRLVAGSSPAGPTKFHNGQGVTGQRPSDFMSFGRDHNPRRVDSPSAQPVALRSASSPARGTHRMGPEWTQASRSPAGPYDPHGAPPVAADGRGEVRKHYAAKVHTRGTHDVCSFAASRVSDTPLTCRISSDHFNLGKWPPPVLMKCCPCQLAVQFGERFIINQ